MNNNDTTGFWDGEECEYCGGPIIDKQVTIHRAFKGNHFLFEHLNLQTFNVFQFGLPQVKKML